MADEAPTTAACVFCNWLGTASGTRVYQDASTFAEVDPRQPHRGHVLVMPTDHIENVFELDGATAAAVMHTTVAVARAVRDAFHPDGLSLWQSNGPGAHQEVPHFHMHVMPRWAGDGLLRIYPNRVETPHDFVREEMTQEIRRHL